MTVTLSAAEVDEVTDVDDDTETATTRDPGADVTQLAALLAQAYVRLPLFP